MRSPKLAAMGVAMLSGLMPALSEPIITPTIMTPVGNGHVSGQYY